MTLRRPSHIAVVGVTGGIGTGKSAVARILSKLGATVIDADQVAHEIMKPGKLAQRRIADTFGEDMLHKDGNVNRKKLAERVFSDPEARERLEAIVHPPTLKHIRERLHRLERNSRVRMVVLDVPLLFETGSQSLVDHVVVVTASPEVTSKRLAARGMPEDEAARRDAAQWDVSAKAALADTVIDNSGDLERTRRQVTDLWHQLVVNTRRKRRD